VDRCALFVDAGYILADGAMAVHGTRHRESVSWNYAGLLQFLGSVAREWTGLPLLRCYWYEATVEGRRSAEHDALADLPGVKLRLGRMRPGRREGVESEIHRDLTTLARNGALQDALVVSAEEDLAQVIADVQDLGLRVTLIHLTVDGNWTISRALRQECDDVVEVNEAHLRPYVELVVGAEPLREDERHAVGAHSGRPLTNGHGHVGPLGQQQALPAGSHPAPPEIYTGPVIAEYQRTAQPALNGQPDTPQLASASGPSAPAGVTPPGPQAGQPQAHQPGQPQVPQPGQPQAAQPGQPQAPQPGQPPMPRRRQARTTAPAPAGSTPQGMAVIEPSPGIHTRPAMPAAQQSMPAGQPRPAMPAAQQAAPAAQHAAPAAQPAPAPGPEPGSSRAMAQQVPQQNMPQQAMSQQGQPQQAMSQGVPQPAAAPGMAGQPGPQPAAPLPQRTPPPSAQPRTQNPGAAPAAAGVPPASQPGPPSPPGLMDQHPAPGPPGMPPSPAQHGHPGTAPHQTAPPGVSVGQPGYPAPPAYQGPGLGAAPTPAGPGGPGTPGAPGAAGAPGTGPGGQGQSDPRQAVAGLQPAPALAALPDPAMGQAGPAGPAMPTGGSVPPGPAGPAAPSQQQAPGASQDYPAPARTGRFTRGSQDQRATQQFPGAPADQAAAGAAYPPQQAPYGAPEPAGSHPPAVQQTSISLPDAVQAAHDEGFTFGQSVAHEAPALWLEAVLARKPRMPSDLEARLLQDSALPIDSLLHDEVRHALRRGFWDALERARS
jgi:hypothetical protein